MNPLELGEGYVSVSYSYPAVDGGLNERRVVLDVFDATFELDKAIEGVDDPIAQAKARRDWLHANGCPDISTGDAWALHQRLYEVFGQIKKKAHLSEPAETPSSTGSPSGGSGDASPPPDWLNTL